MREPIIDILARDALSWAEQPRQAARVVVAALEAAGYVVMKKDMEAFIRSIAWGPPHIIETTMYINSLVDKAQALCPRDKEDDD